MLYNPYLHQMFAFFRLRQNLKMHHNRNLLIQLLIYQGACHLPQWKQLNR